MPHNEVYYVNYPYYNVADGITNTPAPVGHAGVLVGDNGQYKYYEYGVYTDNVYGKAKPDNMQGNWRSVNLTSSNLQDAAQELFALQGDAAGSDIRMTRVRSNPQSVIDAITRNANNVNRDNYQLAGYGVNNCGSNASKAINAGVNKGDRLKNYARGLFKRIVTTPLGGVPELITKKGVTSNAVLNAAGAILGMPATAQTVNLILGENTTNDFENRFKGNEVYTYRRK